jgi:hypothetical protein
VPNQLPGDLLHTMSEFELPRVRTKLQNLPVVPSLAPHPVQANPESTCHRYLGNALVPYVQTVDMCSGCPKSPVVNARAWLDLA